MNQVYKLQIGTESMAYYYDDEDMEALEGLKEMKDIAKKKAGEAGKAIVDKWKEVVAKLLGAGKEIKAKAYTTELMIPKEKVSKMQELVKKIKEFFNLSNTAAKLSMTANKAADSLYDLSNKIYDTRADINGLFSVLNRQDQSFKNKAAAGAAAIGGYIKDTYITIPVSTILAWFADIIKCVVDFDNLVKRFKDQIDEMAQLFNTLSAKQGMADEKTRNINKKISTFTVILSYACSIVVAFISLMQLGKMIKKVANAASKTIKDKTAKESIEMSDAYISDDDYNKYTALESIVESSPFFEATEAFKIDAKKIINTMREKLKAVKIQIKEFFFKLRDKIRGTKVMKETAYAIPDNIVKMIETTISDVDSYVKNGNSYKALESFVESVAMEADSDSEDILRKIKQIREEVDKYGVDMDRVTKNLDSLFSKAEKTMQDMSNSQSRVDALITEAEKNINTMDKIIDGSSNDGKSKATKYIKKALLFVSIGAAFIGLIFALNKFKVKKSAQPSA